METTRKVTVRAYLRENDVQFSTVARKATTLTVSIMKLL